MKMEDTYQDDPLDQLFKSARTEAPKYLFSEASAALAGGLALGVTTAAHAQLVSSTLFKSKFIIMSVSATSIITTSALIYSSLSASPKVETSAKNEAKEAISTEQSLEVLKATKPIETPFAAQFSAESAVETVPNSVEPKGEELASFMVLKPETNRGAKPEKTAKIVAQKPEARTIHFTITERTSTAEFEEIKLKAKESGLQMAYSLKMRKNAIKTMDLTLRNEAGELYQRLAVGRTLLQRPFTFDLSWEVDENGKFLSMSQGEMEDVYEAMSDAEMQRQDEIFAQMEPELQALDSLSVLMNQYADASNEKVEVLMAVSDQQQKCYERLNKLENKENRSWGAWWNKTKNKQEIKQLKAEIADLDVELKAREKEMEFFDKHMNALSDEMDVHSDRINDLDAMLQDPEGSFPGSKAGEMEEIQDRYAFPEQTTPEGLTLLRKEISAKSTFEDLNQLKKEADSVGIDLKFVYHESGNSVKLEYILMMLQSDRKRRREMMAEKGATIHVEDFYLDWFLNEEGMAADFRFSLKEDKFSGNVRKQKEVIPLKPTEIAPVPSIPTELKAKPLGEPTESDLKRINHVITSTTTEAELLEIQKEALDAGVEFYFEAEFKKDKLVHVQICMKIIKDDGRKLQSNAYVATKRRGTFSKPIIWRVNDAGKAVDFGDPNAMCTF